ncbi:copper homeostasis protein CutC [Tessaracoccus sp. SD287]|uniref:copper homeostasis protein CutC n=1 Tax=Tessaracoccus sp. SD287 TaxID=2782008 RepID=UPI001A9636EA|nr:copper homeostasis protein CutC [Tessaracoccus sp. SD287]MBO1030653.1 copper homeostasis protein CutC [Tessaracoccus sp. SD287]
MTGLLEVIALHEHDARRAEEGGADRIELLGTMDEDGLSPEPALVEKVRNSIDIPLRPMVRLRPGFGTDGGEATRLRGLIWSYLDAGADGVVLGFLNGHGDVDTEVIQALVGEGDWPWTFHRAIDHVLDARRAWQVLPTLPRLDQVLTAGSPRGVEHGLDDLLQTITEVPQAASLIMAGGQLEPEHVPWLVRAGVRSFHIGRRARPQGTYKAWVDAGLVTSWRHLIDTEVAHVS